MARPDGFPGPPRPPTRPVADVTQVCRIANVWLCYSDVILPTNASFARLLYELMRHTAGCETLRAAGTVRCAAPVCGKRAP